jgi:fatty-acyl-CoA synthase
VTTTTTGPAPASTGERGPAIWPADRGEPICEMTAGELLRAAAAEVPDRVAVRELVPPGGSSLTGAARTDRTWTYAQLLADAQDCARWLTDRFSPGERVVVWAPNVPEWIVLQYGCALAGLVLVTANPALRAPELRYVLEQSRAVGLFHTASFRGTDMAAIAAEATADLPALRVKVGLEHWPEIVAEAALLTCALPVVRPDEPAMIQYTSGTTGFPKAALLTHRGLVNNSLSSARRAGMTRCGVYLSALPLFHIGGCSITVLAAAHMRDTLLLTQLFDPALMLSAIAEHRPDALLGVPTMLIAIADHPAFATTDVSCIKVTVSGGSMVPPDLVRRYEAATGGGFSILYGQTEAGVFTQIGEGEAEADRTGTVGRPLPNFEVKVERPGGGTAAFGEQGEICARGYGLMLCYSDMPEKTAETIDADGWLHTGDLGTMDERGYIRVTGRLKDMIIRAGENMFPAEIENVLFGHPGLADAVVVGGSRRSYARWTRRPRRRRPSCTRCAAGTWRPRRRRPTGSWPRRTR